MKEILDRQCNVIRYMVQFGTSIQNSVCYTHSASLFTKACGSMRIMLRPCLEAVVENGITDQTTCKIVTHSYVNLIASSNLFFFSNSLQ